MSHFDLGIVGTGSGNSLLDERFTGWSVAIVERDVFGGTCLNRGCIPTKMLVHPADAIETIRHLDRLGVDAHVDRVRWSDIRDRVFGRVDAIAAAGEAYRRSQAGVTVFSGVAAFESHKALRILEGADSGELVTADRWVIAAGARPLIPDIAGLDRVRYHTSDTIMRVDEVPARLAILGGGFIGSELAHVFDAYGSRVSVVTRGRGLLSHHDEDIRRRFTELAAKRFDLHRGAAVERVSETQGRITLDLVELDGTATRLECDALLVAVGRIPNSDLLRVGRTGVEVDGGGFIRTDDSLRTGVEGIWALGDVRTPLMLKHVANHEARIVAHNLLEPAAPKLIDERFVPHAVFTSPQVAAVGLTEAAARGAGYDVVTSIRDYGATAHGWAYEDRTSICKLIADRGTRRLLGAHLMGPQASSLVQLLVQGMRFGQTVDELARDQMYIHPAFTEVVEQALLEL